MLATVQRVSRAEVIIDGQVFSSIKRGCLLFVCFEESDSFEEVKEMTDKLIAFRMLDGPKGISSRSLKDSDEEVLIVSQFTLLSIILTFFFIGLCLIRFRNVKPPSGII